MASNNQGSGEDAAARDARKWMKVLADYREPNVARSTLELVWTAVPLVLLWLAAWAALSISYLLTLIIAVPAAFFLVRLFLIQHDCGHGALFRTRATNDWVGRILGIFTLTAYDVWRRNHATHHASSGNLDHRGIGDIETFTVDEYKKLPRWRRFLYRLYRNPLTMFVIGPSYLFLLQHRLPVCLMRAGWQPWISAMATNLGIVLFVAMMIWLFGLQPFLMVHLPICMLAASIGVWLFYVQHQFEETHWAKAESWNHQEAALYGSSYYALPKPLPWLTAYIGIHHVHHLYSRIPFYRLPQVLRDYPELGRINRITLRDSIRTVRYKLWDAENRRMISFQELRQPA